MPRKTRDVVRLLGVTISRLRWLLTAGKIPLPARDSSGDFVWSDEAIERARQALLTTRRRHARPESEVAA